MNPVVIALTQLINSGWNPNSKDVEFANDYVRMRDQYQIFEEAQVINISDQTFLIKDEDITNTINNISKEGSIKGGALKASYRIKKKDLYEIELCISDPLDNTLVYRLNMSPSLDRPRVELFAVCLILELTEGDVELNLVSQYLRSAFAFDWISNWKELGWRTKSKDLKNSDLWKLFYEHKILRKLSIKGV